jgi:hypothetical protein
MTALSLIISRHHRGSSLFNCSCLFDDGELNLGLEMLSLQRWSLRLAPELLEPDREAVSVGAKLVCPWGHMRAAA